ncbi:hypothetical protein DC20_04460 [Rufibacter tibetensis]|uniref:Uncharacterized protein n=1 Tax=Rufibacter tibetensis TaxID=512763 RepID=A0A0P0CGY8_9BACT|nr:hypothetical protein DC20_04460 [Rufibacter tibetensis]
MKQGFAFVGAMRKWGKVTCWLKRRLYGIGIEAKFICMCNFHQGSSYQRDYRQLLGQTTSSKLNKCWFADGSTSLIFYIDLLDAFSTWFGK